MHVGEAVAAALMLEDEFLVIDAELMQDRRLEVVDMHGVHHGVVGEVVGLASTRHRSREAHLQASRPPLSSHRRAWECGEERAHVTRGRDGRP